MTDEIRREIDKWVDAWRGGDGSTVSGWVTCRLIETYKVSNPNPTLHVERGEPHYCGNEDDKAPLHAVYLIARRELIDP